MMRFVCNVVDPDILMARCANSAHRLTRADFAWLAGKMLGDPMPAAGKSVEDLRRDGARGVYENA